MTPPSPKPSHSRLGASVLLVLLVLPLALARPALATGTRISHLCTTNFFRYAESMPSPYAIPPAYIPGGAAAAGNQVRRLTDADTRLSFVGTFEALFRRILALRAFGRGDLGWKYNFSPTNDGYHVDLDWHSTNTLYKLYEEWSSGGGLLGWYNPTNRDYAVTNIAVVLTNWVGWVTNSVSYVVTNHDQSVETRHKRVISNRFEVVTSHIPDTRRILSKYRDGLNLVRSSLYDAAMDDAFAPWSGTLIPCYSGSQSNYGPYYIQGDDILGYGMSTAGLYSFDGRLDTDWERHPKDLLSTNDLQRFMATLVSLFGEDASDAERARNRVFSQFWGNIIDWTPYAEVYPGRYWDFWLASSQPFDPVDESPGYEAMRDQLGFLCYEWTNGVWAVTNSVSGMVNGRWRQSTLPVNPVEPRINWYDWASANSLLALMDTTVVMPDLMPSLRYTVLDAHAVKEESKWCHMDATLSWDGFKWVIGDFQNAQWEPSVSNNVAYANLSTNIEVRVEQVYASGGGGVTVSPELHTGEHNFLIYYIPIADIANMADNTDPGDFFPRTYHLQAEFHTDWGFGDPAIVVYLYCYDHDNHYGSGSSYPFNGGPVKIDAYCSVAGSAEVNSTMATANEYNTHAKDLDWMSRPCLYPNPLYPSTVDAWDSIAAWSLMGVMRSPFAHAAWATGYAPSGYGPNHTNEMERYTFRLGDAICSAPAGVDSYFRDRDMELYARTRAELQSITPVMPGAWGTEMAVPAAEWAFDQTSNVCMTVEAVINVTTSMTYSVDGSLGDPCYVEFTGPYYTPPGQSFQRYCDWTLYIYDPQAENYVPKAYAGQQDYDGYVRYLMVLSNNGTPSRYGFSTNACVHGLMTGMGAVKWDFKTMRNERTSQ